MKKAKIKKQKIENFKSKEFKKSKLKKVYGLTGPWKLQDGGCVYD